MNHFDEDEALARLRAADPASGAHPDLRKISERLDGRTPVGASGGFAFSDTSDTAVRVHDPDVRTGRGGILVAAAVAALALGGGGYALGTTAGDDNIPTVAANDSSSDDSSSAVTHDAGPALDHGLSPAADGNAAEDMSGDDAMSEESMGGGYAGPVIPVAGEALSTERTTGTVYGASTDSMWSEGEAKDLLQGYADRLGIEGTVQDEGGDFAHVVDSIDGRNLAVYSYGTNSSLDYNNPTLDPWCEDMRAEMENSDGDYGWFGYGSEGPSDITCTELGPTPDEATAIAMAEKFLSQLELDYTGYTVQIQPPYSPEMDEMGGGDAAYATSAPGESQLYDPESTSTEVVVSTTDGPLAGFQDWHLSVTSEGVSYASIQFGDYVELGDYPVISPAEAVERVNDVRFQQLGAYIPTLDYYDEPGYYEEWVEPEPLPPIAPGEPIPYPLTESAVTAAELHTGIVSLWDGTEFIVPVYDLSDGQGNHWQVMGLAEEALDFTP
ncbi:hypothetical protein [Ornithinimicrobium cryptoxanthini]|uniref:Uncharacterized protein n=1 Tax=Ornithinimicrobium cryptoxanthini TaxID=2934161 RepID=A0ABY4YKB7_9MICO|nr:hypothetical protein [Ornithinimicrobium cryptoxanthini]USQ76965.1 hypothetical protein NF557_03320 [Ornithinimicrobium cryptoxanthini]